MVSVKAFLLLALGAEALAGQNAEVTCSTKYGTVSVKHPISKTSTKTQTVTNIKEIVKKQDQTVTPNPKTKTFTDFSTITVTETAGADTLTATETTTDTSTVTTTNTISETQTQTETTTTTSTTTTTTYAAPAGFTPITENSDYVAKRSLVHDRKVKRESTTLSCPNKNQPVKMHPAQYPQSVDCIKISIKTIVKTVTTTVKGRTVTLPAKTSSVTNTQTVTETSTSYPADVTETVTVSTDTTITATEDVTSTTTTTTTSTVQITVPTDFYAACGDSNLITTANGGKAITQLTSSGVSIAMYSATTGYDCCVGCFTTNSAICRGMVFFGSGRCYHYTSTTCNMNQASGIKFQTGSSTTGGAPISNGPCGYIANGGSV